jgi:tetratricopeptide (TPR) repeat protein
MELRHKRVANAERVKKLVDSAFATRYHDIEATLKAASRAVVLAEEARFELPADVIAAAWTEFGNALRMAGRHAEAESALERAAAEPISDTATRIHLLEVTASLHRNTHNFEKAVHLLSTAIEIQRSVGDSDGEARHYNHLGIVYLDSGDRPEALRAFLSAIYLFGPDTPLDVVASTGHNLLETLVADGRFEAAASVLVILEPYYRGLTSTRLAAKAEWLRARLCRGLQQLPAAQLAFERAHALLITEPRAPELPLLLQEMAELQAAMSSSPGR